MTGSRNPNLNTITLKKIERSESSWRKNVGRTKLALTQPREAIWWTGQKPEQCAGFDPSTRKLHSLEIPNLSTCTRDSVREYFNNSWTLTETLFSALTNEESFYIPPYHGLRHPLIFYYVHPAVLYLNKLHVAGILPEGVDALFESLFETGVDEMSWDDMSKNEIEWPSIDEALEYRRKTYALVSRIIDEDPGLADGHKPIHMDDPLWALFMGFEHERIHLETSSVLMRELPVEFLNRPEQWPALTHVKSTNSTRPKPNEDFSENTFTAVNARTVKYGKQFDFPSYGWDNEYGERTSRVSKFEVQRQLVSNGEFWKFVAEGGYSSQEFWTETGWKWRSFRNVKWPSFWVPAGPAASHEYKLRTCFEIIDMQWDWPALVNYHEAKAFARWKSKLDGKDYRLPTEAEHQSMRAEFDFDNAQSNKLIAAEPYNLNLRNGQECSVNLKRREQDQIFDLFGNVWQWLEDHFNPLPGSKVHKYYDDFSTPCYDGLHQMITGGSFISTGDEATAYARFHFRPHFFQHAGFRLVHSPEQSDGAVVHINNKMGSEDNPYESEDVLNEIMCLHFAEPGVQMPYTYGLNAATSFPQRCAQLLIDWSKKQNLTMQSTLDIGCAVGGACFELASEFKKVVGVDLSEKLISAAKELKDRQQLNYKVKVEGQIFEEWTARVPKEQAERCEFRQADACSLPAEFVNFDAVLMANLLCRLSSPQACLSRMTGPRGVVKVGGLLITISPYTWMKQFTPPEVWLGGYHDENGIEHFSEEGLSLALGGNFELLHKEDMPLVIREHRRKFQFIVSQALIWKRIS